MRGTLLTRLGSVLLIIPFVYLIGMAIADRAAWWTADDATQQFRALFLYGCLLVAASFGVVEWFRQRDREDGRFRVGAVMLIFACMVAFFPITAVVYAPVIRNLPAHMQTETELKKIYAALEVYASTSPQNMLPDGNQELRLEGAAWAEVAGEEIAKVADDYIYFANRAAEERRALEFLDPLKRLISSSPPIDTVIDAETGEPYYPNRLALPQVKQPADEVLLPSPVPILFEPFDPPRGGGNVLYLDGRVAFVHRPQFPYTDALIEAVEEMRAETTP